MSIVDKIDKISGTDTRSRNITQAIDKYSGKGPSKNIDDAIKKLDETGTLGKMGIRERIDHLSKSQTMSRDITQAIDRRTNKGPSRNIEEALKNWEDPTPPGPGGNVVYEADYIFDPKSGQEYDEMRTGGYYFVPLTPHTSVSKGDTLKTTITNIKVRNGYGLEWEDPFEYIPDDEPFELKGWWPIYCGNIVVNDESANSDNPWRCSFYCTFDQVDEIHDYPSNSLWVEDESGENGLPIIKFHILVEKI